MRSLRKAIQSLRDRIAEHYEKIRLERRNPEPDEALIAHNVNLLANHLSEIEDEAGIVLDLLTSLRSHAYRGDGEALQESLAEMTISLEHLLHHTQAALPELQQQLDIA